MTKNLMVRIHFMWIKIVILSFIGLIFNSCGNVTAILDDEITLDREVKKEEVVGKWVLSKESYKYIKGKDANKFYFLLDKNGSVEGIANIDCSSAINKVNSKYNVCGDGTVTNFKGEWNLIDNFLNLKYFRPFKVYIDTKNNHFNSKRNPNIVKPLKVKESIGLFRLYHFEFTEKNNKLYVWYLLGDGDSRRYIMYEKKE